MLSATDSITGLRAGGAWHRARKRFVGDRRQPSQLALAVHTDGLARREPALRSALRFRCRRFGRLDAPRGARVVDIDLSLEYSDFFPAGTVDAQAEPRAQVDDFPLRRDDRKAVRVSCPRA